MKRQNQSIPLLAVLAVAPLLPLVVGGWLALTADAIATAATQTAQAQPIPSILLAQAVVDTLPPPPPAVLAKEQLPSEPFTPRELDFQAPVASPASTKSNSYLVYVNDSSFSTLQQIQQLEPKAFVRQYNGRSVIQAGVFSKDSNAQQQAKALQSRGITALIVSLATGEETDFGGESKSYFVVIPASRDDLPLVEDKVKQLRLDMPVNISQKDQPRGTHLKIGPFPERGQAERLNRYMVDSGLRNARVYYGR